MSELQSQVEACSVSFLQLTSQLRELDESTDIYKSLLHARFGLIDAIISLNKILEMPYLISGSICFAPRLFDGCYDLALITKTHGSVDKICTIIWLRPRNKYELKSLGTTYQYCQLKSFKDVLQQGEVDQIEGLVQGGSVWARYEDGIWYKAEVCRKYYPGLQSNKDTMLIEVVFTDFGSERSTLPAEITCITNRKDASHSTMMNVNDHDRIFSDEWLSSDTESEAELVENEKDRHCNSSTAGRLSHASVGNKNTSLATMVAEGYVLGDWERHTKGIGSRLLSRMGYKRGSGLGRLEQGLTKPIDAMKVLKPGVSIDFMNEEEPPKKRNRAGQDEGGTGVRRRRSNGGASQAETGGDEAKEKSTVFDFLNRMESVKQPPSQSSAQLVATARRVVSKPNLKSVF